MDAIVNTLNTLLPVFLLIGLGSLLAKKGFLTETLVTGLNKLVFWVGLPALLFYKIAMASYDFGTAGKTFFVVFAGMLASILLGYIFCFILKVPSGSVGTFVQGAYRGNLLYIGLPVILYSFDGYAEQGQMENIAALVLGFIVPFYNIVAVVVLLASQHKVDKHIFSKLFKPVVTNPLFIACVAGLLYSGLGVEIPIVLNRTIKAAGQMALPLALLGIGGTLARGSLSGTRIFVGASAMIKVVLTPLAGLGIAWAIGLGRYETRIALLFLACPTAVVSFVMAERLGGNSKMAAGIVFLTVIASIVSLGTVLLLSQ